MFRYLKFRHRYIFTRQNRLRLRYVFGLLFVASIGLFSLTVSSPSSEAYSRDALARVNEAEVSSDVSIAALSSEDLNHAKEGVKEKLEPLLLANLPEDGKDFVVEMEPENIQPVEIDDLDRVLKVGAGETIAGILQNVGLNGAEVFRVVKAMGKSYDTRSVKAGQAMSIVMEHQEDGKSLKSLSMKLDAVRELVVTKDEHERFSSFIREKEIILRKKIAKASIQTSLYGSAARAGIPASLVAEMIRIYSYEVDFQRDLRRGDTVQIMYEVYETEDGEFARYGNILFANLGVGGKEIPVYRFSRNDGRVDYFKSDGTNLKRTLMQTPIDGGRISSGYGMRRHPVLGYNKMHKGVDFAAPRGTPIYAAGDGVIDKIGRNGGYGHYVRVKHNGTLKTAYAHLHRYAKGMKRGKRVKQGQVIGYVGSTGRSTGPHLHFEVLKHGKQINPRSIKTGNREKLAGANMKKFKSYVSKLSQKYAVLEAGLKIAQNQISQ